MVELGYLNLKVVVYQNDKPISIQPFNILILDDYMGGAGSFIELIQELQKLIENMVGDLNNAVKLTDKGIPNGVASLDGLGKIPLAQMPQEFQGFLDHINHTVFEHRVHGLGLDEDEQLMYQDNNGDWQYIGFSPTGVGGGATQTVSASISVANSVSTVIYSGVPTVVQSKWSTGDKVISHFTLNGSSFTGNTFPISSTGIHTLYYKDSNGLEYVKTFNVTMDMIARPNVTIKVEDGWVTVTIPPNTSTSIKKWAKGNQTIAYFAYNGTTFTGNSFEVTEAGTYTVYIKTTGGLEYVYTFEVTEAMLAQAELNVAIEKDVGTVYIDHYPYNYIPSVTKFAKGQHNIAYFASNGNTFVNQVSKVTEIGYYTFYYKFTNGIEVIALFDVDDFFLPKDTTPPNLIVTQSQINNSLIRLTVSATDSESGVKNISKPDGTTTTLTYFTYDVSANGNHTFKATDNAGNVATQTVSVSLLDSAPPTIVLSHSPTSWTNGNVTISTNITDNSSGVKTKKWASGDRAVSYFTSSGTTFTGTTFTVSTNGTYTVYAVDNRDNATVSKITITNIDKTAPSLTLSQSNSGTNKLITATYSDSESGVNRIVKPDGTTASGTSTTYLATSNGSFEFTVVDNAGNSSTKSISVTGIVTNTSTRYYVHDGTFYKVDTSGNVYAKGKNSYGQAGVGYTSSSTNSNALEQASITGIISISGNFWLSKSGEVYKTGINYMDGASGYRKFVSSGGANLIIPTKIPNVTNVIKIIGNASSLFYQVSNGDWYAVGNNTSGVLALNTTTQYITTPQKITAFSSQIKDISIHSANALFTLTNGTVWFSGTNQITDEKGNTSPKQISSLSNISKSVNWWELNSAMFINNSGNVYSYGRNRDGEVGVGNTNHITTPTLISSLSGVKDIVAVHGYGYIILNNSNQIYVTGTNDYGALGKGSTSNTYTTPSLLSFSGGTPDYILSDGRMSFVVTTNGRVYGFGEDYNGVLGSNNVYTPTRISNLE